MPLIWKKWDSFKISNFGDMDFVTFKTIIKKANKDIAYSTFPIDRVGIESALNEVRKMKPPEKPNKTEEEKTEDNPIIRINMEDLYEVEKIEWVIENAFQPGSINMLFGSSGVGKSFLAIDLALSISSGKNWLGKRVDNGRFFYLANEGLYGLNQRMAAWYLYYGKPHLKSFWRNSKQLLLSNLTDYKTILKHITEVEEPIKMIFIDTLSQSIRGWNENSSEEMNILIDRLSTLAYYSKASVLCLHHTLKSDSSISRGSSVLLAGMDSAWGLLKDKDNEDTIILSCTKMRNGIVPEKVNLEIEQVKLPSQFDNSFGTTTSALIKEKRIRTEEEMREEEIKKELNI